MKSMRGLEQKNESVDFLSEKTEFCGKYLQYIFSNDFF